MSPQVQHKTGTFRSFNFLLKKTDGSLTPICIITFFDKESVPYG